MEKQSETNVQLDKFWIWRVNREENLLLKELSDNRETETNIKRLQTSIVKAKEVAAKIKARSSRNMPNINK